MFINFHDRLVNFAQYNQEELSPLAERTLLDWLGQNGGVSHLDYAKQLTKQGEYQRERFGIMSQVKRFDRWSREDFSSHLRTWNESKSLMSMTPQKDRKQQVITPARQLEMRGEIQKCKSLG